MELVVKTDFDAAHRLLNYTGKCSNIHGHTWQVKAIFHVSIPKDDQNFPDYFKTVSIDFKELKEALNEILPDHLYLNDLYNFNPTAENLAIHIYRMLVNKDLPIEKVEVWESRTSGVIYEGK